MIIQTTNSVKENKLKVGVYGNSGAGKTTLIKSLLAANYNLLVFDAESGLLPLAGLGIDYIDVSKDDSGKALQKHEKLNRIMQGYQYVLTEEAKKKYDTIVIDSLTEISSIMFDAIRKEYPDNKDNLIVYGLLAQKMKDFLRALRDIPNYHVVFICLSKVEKDQDGRRFAAVDMIGSISDKLPGFLDEFLYLRVNDKDERELICNSTGSILAKDRSGRLDKIEPADLGLIFNKILGK
jgi:phage nucleotide-binding protein